MYLITGTPGTGKTSLAIQFLLEGVVQGERSLYVTLSESRVEISKVARSHGWNLDGLEIEELIPSEHNLSADAQLTVFNPSELSKLLISLGRPIVMDCRFYQRSIERYEGRRRDEFPD